MLCQRLFFLINHESRMALQSRSSISLPSCRDILWTLTQPPARASWLAVQNISGKKRSRGLADCPWPLPSWRIRSGSVPPSASCCVTVRRTTPSVHTGAVLSGFLGCKIGRAGGWEAWGSRWDSDPGEGALWKEMTRFDPQKKIKEKYIHNHSVFIFCNSFPISLEI